METLRTWGGSLDLVIQEMEIHPRVLSQRVTGLELFIISRSLLTSSDCSPQMLGITEDRDGENRRKTETVHSL